MKNVFHVCVCVCLGRVLIELLTYEYLLVRRRVRPDAAAAVEVLGSGVVAAAAAGVFLAEPPAARRTVDTLSPNLTDGRPDRLDEGVSGVFESGLAAI